MLKFAQNEIAWSDISDVALVAVDEGCEVSVTVEETVLVVGVFETASKATGIYDLIEASRVAASNGGVTITVIIDDL